MGDSAYKLSKQPGYILVEREPDSEVILDEQLDILADISTACKDAGCRNVLLLGPKTKVKLSIMDIFNLGQEIAKLGVRIAVVESHDASNEDVDFLEAVVFNRGRPIQFFDTKKDAKDWLGVS
jgi:hypothetical protein